ncbi:MAG: FAD-dependent oxidoreductase [Paracoccus sp. (in: a-proteobacteria)]|nr:FAD-dependent oxidoreductase [Paracoccus sp. (in: a-proteobacteria)]
MSNRRDAATRKDDLRTGQPFWLRTPRVTVPAGRLPAQSGWDAIIVGAGISGALMAESLSRAGLKTLVLDRRDPVRGSTPASTAMIQHEIDVPLTRHIRDMGKARAQAVWRRSARAVDDLVALVDDLEIDCAMQPKRALYLTGDDMGARAMKAEASARQAAGLAAEFLNHSALLDRFGIDRTGAIVSAASASANPAQLTAGLLCAAKGRGAVVAAPVEITDLAELDGGVALATRDGCVVTAGQVVFCTGYEFLPVMQSRSHRITSTWALASGPRIRRPGWLDDFLVWEAADPYLYYRSTPDGRIIAGGEDEDDPDRNDDPALLVRKAAAIAKKLRDLAGIDVGEPAYVWSAPFGNTTDGLPIIDRVPGHRRAFAVMGFGGNGITFSMIAAQIVTAAILGKPDKDAGLFAFR